MQTLWRHLQVRFVLNHLTQFLVLWMFATVCMGSCLYVCFPGWWFINVGTEVAVANKEQLQALKVCGDCSKTSLCTAGGSYTCYGSSRRCDACCDIWCCVVH
jgi:hypothetical protein